MTVGKTPQRYVYSLREGRGRFFRSIILALVPGRCLVGGATPMELLFLMGMANFLFGVD